MTRNNIFSKVKWFIKWKIVRFPDDVKTYGLKYAFQKEYIDPWWRPLQYGVQNLIKYFPVIWKDRDWDYCFWIDMNIKKLESMEDSIRNHSHHLYCGRDADNIKKAVLALKRLREDDYHENAFKNHNKKYGKLRMDFCPPDEDGCSLARFSRSKTTRERDIHYESKASSRLYKHGEYMKKQDLEYVTKIISKYLFHWWD